jgi:hypothetical protein
LPPAEPQDSFRGVGGLRNSVPGKVAPAAFLESWRPRGSCIGSSNGRFQPRSATGAPIGRHAFVTIEAAIFLSGPDLVVAPFLKVSFAPLGQIISPCCFECRTGSIETRCCAVPIVARIAARIEAAAPFPAIGVHRVAGAFGDGANVHIAIIDEPGFLADVRIDAAGEAFLNAHPVRTKLLKQRG